MNRTAVVVVFLWLMAATIPYLLIASALDWLFGWGITDATRDLLDPIIPDGGGTNDPGDCDRRYGSC